MSTIIELPDDLAERLRTAAAAKGMELNNYVIALLESLLKAEDKKADDDFTVSLNNSIGSSTSMGGSGA